MNNKIFVSLIIVLFIVGIGCVSAESIDDIGDLSTNEAEDIDSISVEESLDDNMGSDESDLLADSTDPVTDWAGLGSKVSGTSGDDTVYIGANLTPSGQIVINHDVTIIGSADTYIGGSSSSNPVSYNYIPIYSDASGLSITLKNIRFQNCGGNILMQFSGNGNYNIENCTFENCTATDSHQAIVYLNYGYANITDCTFEKCTTSYGTVSNYNAASVDNVHMVVRGTTFKDNTANPEPGAINNCGHLIVYDSVFEGNSATWWAGAIHTHYRANTTIVRSSFKNNIAGWNGGALYTYSTLTVIDSNFTANEAHYSNGGAIAASSSPYVTVENCRFDGNIAYGSGGAVSIGSGTLTVDNSEFNNNKANAGTGGAISTSGATSNINDSRFINNTASARGGAVYATGVGTLNVYNSEFVNNTGSEGNDLAYYYTTKRTNRAFFNYDYNEFWGANNASDSIYAYNTAYLTYNPGNNNVFNDISGYVVPGEENTTNDTNGSSGDIIVPDSFNGNQLWNASLEGALGGTPLINGDVIYVPNGQSIYCLNITNGALLWNVSSEWGYFHELALHNGVLVAPCAWDKLYFFDAATGSEIVAGADMYKASSNYTVAINGDTIYVSSEYPYGDSGNAWIAVVKLVNGVYTYTGSILDITGVEYGSQALLSQPILNGGYLWVNTINGLVRVDLTTNASSIVLNDTVGKPVVGGNIIYVLTGDNHIIGVSSTGSIVTNIAVDESLGVGSTLAISNDGTVLYTVCADGSIYAAETTDSVATFITKVNPVSSALTVGDDGYLYVGDDAGILWVFNIIFDSVDWEWNIVGAYNITSMINAVPLFENNIVYIGTNDTFYALFFSLNNVNSLYNHIFVNNYPNTNELLGITQFNDILTESVDITVDTLTTNTFANSNTIYELVNENYNYDKGLNIGYVKPNFFNNIVIRSKNGNKVRINIRNINTSPFNIMGNNITLENIIFSGETKLSTNSGIFAVRGAENVTIKNCTFENVVLTSTESTKGIFFVSNFQSSVPKNIIFEGCQFINCSSSGGEFLKVADDSSVTIKDCTFDNVSSRNSYPFSFLGTVNWENSNILNSNVKTIFNIQSNDGEFYVSFNVLTKTLTANTNNDIVAELVDDNGNHIYASGLKFTVNGTDFTPVFDKNTGLYTLTYSAPESGNVHFMAKCSNIKDFYDEERNLNVVSSPELTINGTSSITYGDTVINVNATLREDINGENVTFTILKGSTVINSTTAVVTNGFANATFNNKLNAGSYTLSVSYEGSETYGSASDSKTLTVGKATPNINVSVDSIYVGNDIIIKVNVPEDVVGSFEVCNIGRPTGANHVATAKENVKIDNTTVTLVFDDKLSAGEYVFWYSFVSSNSNYANKATNGYIYGNLDLVPIFEIIKYESIPQINVNDVCLGDNVSISVSGLNESATGNITIIIDDLEPQTIDIKETYNISSLGAGVHTVKVVYSGDDKFSGNETSETFNVFTIALENYDLDYDENMTVVAVLPADAEGMLGIEIDGKDPISAPVVNGSATFKLSNLKPGNYTLHMVYQGTPIGLHADVNVTVIPKIRPMDELDTVDNTISLDLPSDATGNLTITIDGNTTIVVPVENGTAKYSIENLTAGDHNITVAYEGNYPSYTSTQSVTVAKGTPQTQVDAPSSITAGSAVTLPITFPSDANGIVLVDVDGKKYYAEVVNGTAKVDIAGLTAGDKVLTYKYLGDDKYAAFTANATLKVTEPKSTPASTPAKAADKVTLTLKKVTVKRSAKKLVIKATLKINGKAKKGLKVTFKFKGKKYTAKTNAKGIAKITVKKSVLKKLKKGKKVTYTATYGKVTKKVTVKVKK